MLPVMPSRRNVASNITPRVVAGLLALVALSACSEHSLTAALPANSETAVRSSSTVTTPESGPWSRIVTGETGPGSLYQLFVPRGWNGDAVYFAHGFRDAASPVDLRDQDGLVVTRDALGAQGYAVAYSSYSANGFAVKDGVQRTHQLRGLLATELSAAPKRNLLIGHSLGGGVALDIAERYVDQYDGALLVCGMVGGSLLETQYLGNVRALFDAYYPNVLPGNVLGVPAGTVVTIPQIIAAITPNPLGMFAIASTAQTPLPSVPGNLADPASAASQTLVGSLYGALSFHARGINNIVDLVHGKSPFDNSGVQYVPGAIKTPVPALVPAITALIAGSNASVTRYTADEAAQQYMQHNFTPTGDLRFPVLTVHNMWDPAVPAFHEDALRERVIAAGATANLLQRQVPSYGHCNISPAMVLGAFGDLAGWVQTGIKPSN